MGRNTTQEERKRKASANFNQLLADGKETPHGFLVKVLRGEIKKPDAHKVAAARDLLPYSLPRLQAIEAVPQGTLTSHEDALDLLDGEDGDGKTP